VRNYAKQTAKDDAPSALALELQRKLLDAQATEKKPTAKKASGKSDKPEKKAVKAGKETGDKKTEKEAG